jgi:predicted enzyme related to lactoylglutathione lyase
MVRFYTDLFGARETSRVPEEGPIFYLGLQVGDTTLGLVSNPEVHEGGAARILLSVGVDDVDASLERVESAGGAVKGPPNDMPWGQRVAHISDPDGNPVNLTQDIAT